VVDDQAADAMLSDEEVSNSAPEDDDDWAEEATIKEEVADSDAEDEVFPKKEAAKKKGRPSKLGIRRKKATSTTSTTKKMQKSGKPGNINTDYECGKKDERTSRSIKKKDGLRSAVEAREEESKKQDATDQFLDPGLEFSFSWKIDVSVSPKHRQLVLSILTNVA
jgi:hypothetical protein